MDSTSPSQLNTTAGLRWLNTVQRRLRLGCAMLLVVVITGSARSDRPELTPQPGILIMRTGHVLRGDIIRVGDRYVVTTGPQDELRVPVSRVEFRCRSLDEAYRAKQRILPVTCTVADHLKLASWCLQYGMFSAAAEQLMESQQLAPDSPENQRFERRLRLTAHQTDKQQEQPKVPPVNIPQPKSNQIATELRGDTVRQFTTAIQPLLMNRCSANACHGGRSNRSFRLIRPTLGHSMPRHYTQKNLQAALSQIDRSEPSKSPLLVMPTVSDGGAHKLVFGQADFDQIELLAFWVERVTGNAPGVPITGPQTAVVESSFQQETLERGSAPTAAGTTSHLQAIPLASPLTSPSAPRPQKIPVAASKLPPASSEVQVGQAPDPFDPEIFNRRYLKR